MSMLTMTRMMTIEWQTQWASSRWSIRALSGLVVSGMDLNREIGSSNPPQDWNIFQDFCSTCAPYPTQSTRAHHRILSMCGWDSVGEDWPVSPTLIHMPKLRIIMKSPGLHEDGSLGDKREIAYMYRVSWEESSERRTEGFTETEGQTETEKRRTEDKRDRRIGNRAIYKYISLCFLFFYLLYCT